MHKFVADIISGSLDDLTLKRPPLNSIEYHEGAIVSLSEQKEHSRSESRQIVLQGRIDLHVNALKKLRGKV